MISFESPHAVIGGWQGDECFSNSGGLRMPLVYGGNERGRVAKAQALFFSGNFGLLNRAADSRMSADGNVRLLLLHCSDVC